MARTVLSPSISERDGGTPLDVDLREREKELDFIYELAPLLAGRDLGAEAVAAGTARLFAAAVSRPGEVRVEVSVGSVVGSFPEGARRGKAQASAARTMEARAGSAPECRITASYTSRRRAAGFSARERSLCASAAAMLAVAAERLAADDRERAYRQALEAKNAALSELLSRIELEKGAIRKAIKDALDERVLPLVSRLAALVPEASAATEAAWLEARLRRELGLALGDRGADRLDPRRRLSVRELEVCDLVASGLSSKEIAERLGIALATVERHRHNARRKLEMPAREGSLAAALGD